MADDIKIYENETIEDGIIEEVASFQNLVDKPIDLAGINKTEGDFLTQLNNAIVNGTARTTDDTPALKTIIAVTATKPLIVMATISAINQTSHYNAGFIRKAIFKYSGGVAALAGQIQDIFTMRDQDYKVDFDNHGANIRLRLWGLAGQTIDWTYSVLILNNL
jgi:protein-disulfide isomerase-like protein with CxxC motif